MMLLVAFTPAGHTSLRGWIASGLSLLWLLVSCLPGFRSSRI